MGSALEARRADILAAASLLLKSGGLSALTTNALASAAQCSKKTIYVLFPEKDSLLAALVSKQATQLSQIMEEELTTDTDGHLEKIGAALIAVLLSENSIAINRAAIADPTGRLGNVLRANGRDQFADKIGVLLAAHVGLREGSAEQIDDLFQNFYGLLLGDRQVAALHGAPVSTVNEKARLASASRAINQIKRIYS
jgi:AcrR family transcriptional regulator